MYIDLLPIGSIVLLSEGEKRLMICGRIQGNSSDEKIYDYVGCMYPEGIMSIDSMIFFNREMIEKVVFTGYEDDEEQNFREEILSNVGELKIENGEILRIE